MLIKIILKYVARFLLAMLCNIVAGEKIRHVLFPEKFRQDKLQNSSIVSRNASFAVPRSQSGSGPQQLQQLQQQQRDVWPTSSGAGSGWRELRLTAYICRHWHSLRHTTQQGHCTHSRRGRCGGWRGCGTRGRLGGRCATAAPAGGARRRRAPRDYRPYPRPLQYHLLHGDHFVLNNTHYIL